MRACREDVVGAVFDLSGNAGRTYGKDLGGITVTKVDPEPCHLCGMAEGVYDVRIRGYPSKEERDRALQAMSDFLEAEKVVSPDRPPV